MGAPKGTAGAYERTCRKYAGTVTYYSRVVIEKAPQRLYAHNILCWWYVRATRATLRALLRRCSRPALCSPSLLFPGWAIFPVDSDQLLSTDMHNSTLNVDQDVHGAGQSPPSDSRVLPNASSAFDGAQGGGGQYGQPAQQQQAYASNSGSAGGSRLNPAFSPFSAVAQQPFAPPVSVTANSAAMVSGSGLQITSTQDIGKIDSFSLASPPSITPSQVTARHGVLIFMHVLLFINERYTNVRL